MRANYVLETTIYNDRERDIDSHIADYEALLQGFSDNDIDIDQYILGSDAADKSERETSELDEQVHLNTSSFPAITGSTNVESIHLLPESVSSISPAHIKEKLPSQTKEFVDDPQSSSQTRVYLQLPSTQTGKFKIFHSILKHLFDTSLVISSDEQRYCKLLKENDLLVIVHNLSTDDDKLVLEKICSLGTSISLYILGTEPDTVNTRQEFYTKYPQVCAISDDPEELASKVALDVALKSRTTGGRYARNKDNDRANKMYDQCIGLLNQLNVLALKNMDNSN